jgi:hypothetical protein
MGLAKHGCQLGAAYVVLYFGILGLSPAAFDLYMKQFRNMEGPEDLSLEPQITNAREVFGVHDYDEVVNISSGMDEVIIFRNFSDCRHKFETSLLPRRKDQYDTYRLITPTNHTGNVYVTGYTKGGTISKTLGETIADESPTYYASFLRLFDKHDYAELLGTNDADQFKFDSSFVSYFPYDAVSSPIHAAPIAQTFSVQCYGTKAWLFWSSRTLNAHGHRTVTHPAGGVITGTPEGIVRIPTTRAVVGPNDLLVFGPLQYHAVASAKGKNIMFAIRKVDKNSFRASMRQSAHDTVFHLIRYLYDRPQQYLAIIFDSIKARYDAQLGGSDAGGSKLGFSDAGGPDRKSFQDKYQPTIADVYRSMYVNHDGIDYFQLPKDA